MSNSPIPFNRAHLTGQELANIEKALQSGKIAGDGSFTKQCHEWLQTHLRTKKALLTHSCTAALEMAALLLDLAPGDEVIMPSFTFVSTANAVVLRGAVPVFIDVHPETMNMDERLIRAAITPKTRAIFVVHYAGVGCEMDEIMAIAREHKLFVVEDAAQGILAKYKDRYLGTIGHLGCLSFHETKNIVSGEGGALLINDERFSERAEIIREKGTNRSQFFRGEVDKYTWVDVGSSYLPSELIAAALLAQLQAAPAINQARIRVWKAYHNGLAKWEQKGLLKRAQVPSYCEANAHMYFIFLPSLEVRTRLIQFMKELGVHSVFHYIPLHSSPAGRKYGRALGDLPHTTVLADQLLRLPVWADLSEVERVLQVMDEFFSRPSFSE